MSSLICSFEFHKPKLRVVDDFRQSQMNRLAHSSVQRFAQQLMDSKTSLDAFQHLAEFSPPLYVHQNIFNLIRLYRSECGETKLMVMNSSGRASDRQIYTMFCSQTQSSVVPVLSSSLQENEIK